MGQDTAFAQFTGKTVAELCSPIAASTIEPLRSPCDFLDPATINQITGLNVGPGVETNKTCVYLDPSKAPAVPNLDLLGGLLAAVTQSDAPPPARAGLFVVIGESGGGDNSGDGGGVDSHCAVTTPIPGLDRQGGIVTCLDAKFGLVSFAGRSAGSLSIGYFPAAATDIATISALAVAAAAND